MSKPPPDTADVARARQMWDQGDSLRDIGRAMGKSRETIRRWSTNPADPWPKREIMRGTDGQARPVLSTEDIEQARLRADKARQEARARWGVRRSEEADAVGLSAGIVRSKIMGWIQKPDPTLEDVDKARKLAVVYGIFVDKANILSGESIGQRRQGDEAPAEPRPSDPAAMVAAGAQRALRLVNPAVDVASTER